MNWYKQSQQKTISDIITSIIEDSIVFIDNIKYIPYGKAIYAAKSKPDAKYVKIFFKGDYVLVAFLTDNSMYFGKDYGNLGEDLPQKNSFIYKDKEYKQTDNDYQILVKSIFGEPNSIEGEMIFYDYEPTDSSHIISLGLLEQTQERSDLIVKRISIEDITVRSK